ncbi:MAG: prepilin peptidase [Candidatus Omnitrophica bacterium]|nr:prepilin peptidase [Candidatus Omnitrophota bacterium]
MLDKIAVFIFGSLAGSFLNVCIHRMPLGESVVRPRSHCPKCKKTIPWYDNVPFLSYLMLGGRCRFCKEKIPLRYFTVELLTAGVFLTFYQRYGLSFDFIFYVIFSSALIVATFVDINHRIIPDEVSLGGIALGLLFNGMRGLHYRSFAYDWRPLINSFLGIIIGGGVIWLTGFLFDQVYFKLLKKGPIDGETESMGFGDVKLLAMVGAFLGWPTALLTFFLAPFFAAVVGVINLIWKKSHTIPYGPFLSLAAFICVFWFNQILKLIFAR